MDSLLNDFSLEFERELREKQQIYQEKKVALDSLKSQLNPVIVEQREADLLAMESSLQQFVVTAEKAIAQKNRELYAPILATIQQAIDEVAMSGGYTHVINTDSGTQPVLLYAQEGTELTDRVITQLGFQVKIDEKE